MLPFVNRKKELLQLDQLLKKPQFVVFYGRRRHGKTRLLRHWLDSHKGIYLQAIEGNEQVQLNQLYFDLVNQIDLPAPPQNWDQFFKLIDSTQAPLILCIDEFPYLVETNPSLPSILQKWWDHRKKKNISLILSGSSRRMMENIFLDDKAPLFGRASQIIRLQSMSYSAFCAALHVNPKAQKSFQLYSITGGIPKYWELINPKNTVLQNVEELYFSISSIMEQEPHKWLEDDKVKELVPLSVLTAIGNGAHKPSEIASRMNTKQTNLSRTFELLTKYDFIKKEIPFGVSPKDNKKVLYSIADPTLKFWFDIYQVHRNVWKNYTSEEKNHLLLQHSSQVFEQKLRENVNGQRYWESHIEFDAITRTQNQLVVYEMKFNALTDSMRKTLLTDLKLKWEKCQLYTSYPNPHFIVLGMDALAMKDL